MSCQDDCEAVKGTSLEYLEYWNVHAALI